MRKVGVAVLGVFLGLLLGFLIFSELIGRILVGDDGLVEAPWTFVIGFGPQVLAIVGGVVAVSVDSWIRRRKGSA